LDFGSALNYQHWLLLGLSFWLLDRYKIGRLSIMVAFAAVLQGVLSYLQPDLAWYWQVWGFVMMLAIGSILYLHKEPRKVSPASQAERKLTESSLAASLVGKQVLLSHPLYPGSSKLELGGRFWKVSAKRDFPAGTTVEVVGHQGNTLEIVSSEASSVRGEKARPRGTLSLDVYHRDEQVEAQYGEPDFTYWALFQEALQEHRKLPLVYAYHVLSGLQHRNLDKARRSINTYTLALYDTEREGQYLTLQKQMYSQPRIYNFLYMNGEWTGNDLNRFEEEINQLVAALHTDWAKRYRGDLDPAMVLRAVMMIRKQQVGRLRRL